MTCGCNLITFQGQCLISTFLAWLIAFGDILTLLNGCNRSSIGTGAANTQFFQLTNQTGFVVSDGTLGKTLCSNNRVALQHITDCQDGQIAFCFRIRLLCLVLCLFIHAQETVELYNLTAGNERFLHTVNTDSYLSFLYLSICHLAGQGAFPD